MIKEITMKKISVLLVLLFLVWTTSLWGQENSRVGTAAAQFLKIGVGARSAALGECGTATPGITGLYWNPAAIASVDRMSLFFAQSSMYAGLSHSFFGFGYPLGAGNTVGIGVIYMGSDDIEITTLAEPEGVGTFYSLSNYAVNVSYGRYVTDRLSLGMAFKFVQEGIYREKARTFAVDFGSLLDTGLLGLKIAMSLSNFGGNMQMSGPDLRVSHDRWADRPGDPNRDADLATEGWPLPMIFRIGLSSSLIGIDGQLTKSEMSKLTLYADAYDSNDTLLRSNFGLEYVWNNLLALRGGYRGFVLGSDEFQTYDTKSYSFGAGLNYTIANTNISFDYAYTDYQVLGNTQQISLLIQL
jgi:hypothetical protein